MKHSAVSCAQLSGLIRIPAGQILKLSIMDEPFLGAAAARWDSHTRSEEEENAFLLPRITVGSVKQWAVPGLRLPRSTCLTTRRETGSVLCELQAPVEEHWSAQRSAFPQYNRTSVIS